MSYVFPSGLYTDVRIEHVFSTNISYTFRELEECKEKGYSAAFIRVYDGDRWYYGSTSNIGGIQAEINALAKLAKPNDALLESEIYKRFSDSVDEVLVYSGSEVSGVALEEKIALLGRVMPFLEANGYIKLWNVRYLDEYKLKEFYSSKGANLKFDTQRCGFACRFQMADGDALFRGSYQKGRGKFSELCNFEEELSDKLKECQEFLLNSQAVEPGKYTVVLAPSVTGVFAHECFGHKSESDFMIGDEESRKEWVLGKTLGNEELSIIDAGGLQDTGYTPYDDEGNRANATYLIKNGVLTGRLHNSASAADLDEAVTGNGRSMSYEYEPIVRMTNTYIDKGSKTVKGLISEIDRGILVKDIAHGSGMSTFTLAPTLAYKIENGKIGAPVRVSVVSGSVFEALSDIDGISDTVEYASLVTGGCGKMEQWPLAVGFGGPYIRVRDMNVQGWGGGAVKKEIISDKTKMTKLSITNNRISAILRSEDEKTGLRLYSDGCIGIAGAIGKYDDGELTRKAQDMLAYKVPYDCAPTENVVQAMDFSRRFELSDEELVETSTCLLDALKTKYPAFSYSHIIRYVEKEISLRNDAGTDLLYKDKYVTLELLMKYKGTANLMDGFAVNQTRIYSFDDAFSVASEFCEAYEEKVELPYENKEKMPVVLLSEHELFLGKFFTDLNGKQYGTDTLLFAGRIGEKIFSEKFSLQVNRNPLDTYGCFFDGEGTVRNNNSCMLIENGVLKMPYATKKTAQKYGFTATSSASLEYDAVPDAVTDGISVGSSGKTVKELLQGRKSILVVFASGGDFTAQGEYATPVQAAYLFDGEKIYGRLPQLTLSSTVFDMFGKDFIGVSSDSNSPHNPFKYLVADMNVSKTGGHM